MFRQVAHSRSTGRDRLGLACCFGEPTTWFRSISARADSKLSPCMARPNLFSGD
jgi:hypothetical protein